MTKSDSCTHNNFVGRCELDNLNHALKMNQAGSGFKAGTKIRIYKLSN